MSSLQDLLERLRGLMGGQGDAARPQVIERIVLEKFDKTEVVTPGVDGLTPYETIIIENGVVVSRTPAVPPTEGSQG